MMKSNVSGSTPETKHSSNLSRVLSVEIPDSRDGASPKAVASCKAPRPDFEIEAPAGIRRAPLRGIQSPMDALRMSMASPFRNFLGLLKPPPLPIVGSGSSSLHGGSLDPESPCGSTDSVESLDSGRLALTSGGENRLDATRRAGQNVVLVAFDANAKEVSHAGILWAMEHVLMHGDVLAIVSVMDSVRGAMGYRVKIGDAKWVSANQKLIEEEVQQKMEVWRTFPGLDRRCGEGCVKLVVMVKAARRGELAIAGEAMKLGACHVVLDKSLNNRHRRFYLQNLACNVTRMRRCGGVDVIRPVPEPRSPTSVIPPLLLSYGDQIDEFEISLHPPKPKRLVTLKLSPPVASPSKHPLTIHRSTPSQLNSQFTSSESQLKSEDLRCLSSSATLATAHERSSSSSQSTTTTTLDRLSSAITPSLRESLTSSSTATDSNDIDDDLFSIYHGSTRYTDVDIDADADLLFTIPNPSSGYESDDLFSIGNASTRHPSPPPEGRPSNRHIHHHHSLSIPDTAGELVVTEPLRQATISRITFVVGMGDSVTLTLRSPLHPGEGLLVGTSPSALFLMHTDHRTATTTTTLSTATPNSYIAMEGKMAMKLSFLEPGQGVLAVDALGRARTVRVEKASAHKKPLVLVEAQCEGRRHGVLLHHTDTTVGLLRHSHSQSWGGNSNSSDGDGGRDARSVTGLTVGGRVLLRLRSAEPSHAIWST